MFKRNLVLLLLTCVCTLSHGAQRKLDVLIRAWASDTYIRNVDASGKPAVETCTYAKGEYYPGAYNNPESKIHFDKVAQILAGELSKENYQMATDPANADLLLVINWGMTEEPEDDITGTEFNVDEFETEDGDSFDFIESEIFVDNQTRELNTQLIGAGSIRNISRISPKYQAMEQAIRQERYFINVIAFSMKSLREPTEGKKPEPQWITILSVPLQRTEPDLAFGTMFETASVYFGKNLKNADFVREDAKRATVTIGELEFLGTEE